MAWNDSGNGKDPWKRDGDEPNDLDQIVQNWQRKLSSIIGGGGSGKVSGGGFVLAILLLIAWALTGLYRVDQAERGVVQRFGAYTITTMPGLRWHYPFPIETVDIVNVGAVEDYQFSTEMLTSDRKYVYIQMVVQFRRNDAVAYSFNVQDPEQTLHDVSESALREVVGTSTLESLVTEQRSRIGTKSKEVLQQTLDIYGAGITVSSISLETLDYPQLVQEAVDDTQMAGNDRDRYILEAETYANDVIPKARGGAARTLRDAEAYRDRVIAESEGAASRFEALLTEYQKAPRVTRDRLYLDAVEEVYANSNKVILDTDGSGNLLYLPIDKLIQSGSAAGAAGPPIGQQPAGARPQQEPDASRERRTRQ